MFSNLEKLKQYFFQGKPGGGISTAAAAETTKKSGAGNFSVFLLMIAAIFSFSTYKPILQSISAGEFLSSIPQFLLSGTGLIFFIVYAFVMMYFFHLVSHYPVSYPMNTVHLYHHAHSDWLSHFTQINLEFIAATSIVFLLSMAHGNAKVSNKTTQSFSLYGGWSVIAGILRRYIPFKSVAVVIFFLWFFYTTVHNVNYSILHINRVHEHHHQFPFENLGPDFCDIFFGTKYRFEEEAEDISHYVPNICAAVLCLFCYEVFIDGFGDRKEWMLSTFNWIFLVAVSAHMIFTAYFLVENECCSEPWQIRPFAPFYDHLKFMDHDAFIRSVEDEILRIRSTTTTS